MLPSFLRRQVVSLVPQIQTTSALHASTAQTPRSEDGRVTCTLIPGDGVGPEIMDSVQEVLQSMGAKINFEEMCLSEVLIGTLI